MGNPMTTFIHDVTSKKKSSMNTEICEKQKFRKGGFSSLKIWEYFQNTSINLDKNFIQVLLKFSRVSTQNVKVLP
jgi:hypothetical protein